MQTMTRYMKLFGIFMTITLFSNYLYGTNIRLDGNRNLTTYAKDDIYRLPNTTTALLDNTIYSQEIDILDDAENFEGEFLEHYVILSYPSDSEMRYAFSIEDNTTSDDDYNADEITFTDGVTLNNGQITVPAGVTEFIVIVPTLADGIDEGTETYTIHVGDKNATGTIIGLGEEDTITLYDAEQNAGAFLEHEVILSAPSANETRYAFSIENDNDTTSDDDYEHIPTFSTLDGNDVNVSYDSTTNEVVVGAGVTEFYIKIYANPNDDNEFEEIIYVITLGDTSAIGLIYNSPTPSVGITSDINEEGTELMHFVTALASATDETYSFSIVNVTTSDDDYGTPTFSNGVTLNNGQITVPAGVTEFIVTVPTLADGIAEGAETYTINVGDKNATGTIIDLGEEDTITLDDAEQFEGEFLEHQVILSTPSANETRYAFSIENGTTSDDDYEHVPTFSTLNGNNVDVSYDSTTHEVVVGAGVTEFYIKIFAIHDNNQEYTEFYTMHLGDKSARGAIYDIPM